MVGHGPEQANTSGALSAGGEAWPPLPSPLSPLPRCVPHREGEGSCGSFSLVLTKPAGSPCPQVHPYASLSPPPNSSPGLGVCVHSSQAFPCPTDLRV